MTRVAVLGHTEWVQFVRVARQPDRGGLVEGEPLFERAAGGAVVAAATLAALGAEVDFYTALADDARSARARAELEARGIVVHAATRPGATTRFVFTTLEDGGERTIVTVGQRHAPRLDDGLDLRPLRAADGVYATAADADLLGVAAQTGALVVTTRIGPPDRYAAVGELAAAVFSDADASETAQLAGWARIARRLVATEGARGGHWREGAPGASATDAGAPAAGTTDARAGDGHGHGRADGPQLGRWSAVTPPGPVRDAYGCGDAFAAGFTYGLAAGEGVAGAAAIGARCGAEQLTRVGGP